MEFKNILMTGVAALGAAAGLLLISSRQTSLREYYYAVKTRDLVDGSLKLKVFVPPKYERIKTMLVFQHKESLGYFPADSVLERAVDAGKLEVLEVYKSRDEFLQAISKDGDVGAAFGALVKETGSWFGEVDWHIVHSHDIEKQFKLQTTNLVGPGGVGAGGPIILYSFLPYGTAIELAKLGIVEIKAVYPTKEAVISGVKEFFKGFDKASGFDIKLPPELIQLMQTIGGGCILHPVQISGSPEIVPAMICFFPGGMRLRRDITPPPIPVETQTSALGSPFGAVLRFVLQIYDDPSAPLGTESFINPKSDEQRETWERLYTTGSIFLILADLDGTVTDSLETSWGEESRRGAQEQLRVVDQHNAKIGDAFDFDKAKQYLLQRL